ncbi:MAG TPA: glycosyl hydrolase [Kiritimatiellia bacterium]|nr:glycosyl hydrolase [Kiritimatiellia bacterium]HPS09487.1 glycosyl hydrolase [Kiritimatiellia bacterium]
MRHVGIWVCVLAVGAVFAQEPQPLFAVRPGIALPYKNKTVTMGQEFVATKPLYVTALGYLDEGGDGLAKDRCVRLYRVGDEALLATGTVTRTAGEVRAGFRFAALPLALRLTPGRYVVVADFEEGSDRYLSMADVADFNEAGGAVANPKIGRWSTTGRGYPESALSNLNGMAVHMTGASLLFTLTAPAAWTEGSPLPSAVPLVDELDGERLVPCEGAVDRQALPMSRALLAALRELSDQRQGKILSGQFMGWYPLVSLATANEIFQQTSNWVAVAGFDYYETFVNTPKTKPDLFKPPRWRLVNELAKAHYGMGGLVTLSCHMTNPWDGGLAWSKAGRFEDLLDETTPAYARYMEQVDEVARGLADLQDAGVPVLFRPFHEMTGAFWWGARNPVAFRKLWRNLFEYYTSGKGLHNLVWVWSPLVSMKALDYYPGNAFVDMTGLDIYADSVATATNVYAELMKTGKPFAVTEFGPPGNSLDNASPRNYDYGPFAQQCAQYLPRACYFLAWRDAWGLHRNLNACQLLDDPRVLNRGELAFASRTQGFERFITRDGNRLMDGGKDFRFMGANMPGLVVPYDFTLRLPERMTLPTAWEIEDAMKTLSRMGMRVVRTWNLPMRGPEEAPQPWHYVLAPGQFNEAAFRTIDQTLALANKHGVRVMLCLSAGSGDYLGGIGTYAAHRGKKREAFWTDPQLREDYKTTVRYVLGRVNTVTGVPYREDKAILAWQFGNEMHSAQTDWLSEMAAYMKSLDPNHLVAETRHHPAFSEQLIDPNIDLLTRHYYTDYKGSGTNWVAAVKREVELIKGQRPFFVGEFGPYIDGKVLTRENVEGKLKDFLDACVATDGVSGALLWSMYFHHRDGGYYWHQIFTYPSVWSYHFPGFASADAQAEIGILREMRAAAFRIRGEPVPPVSAPDAPELLPFREVPLFSWRGSAGAEGYDIERAVSSEGPWSLLKEGMSDAEVAYRPLFSDETAKAGETWFYRVTARNAGGKSPPSSVVGPVAVKEVCFVDEFHDLARVSGKSGGLVLDNAYNARYAEHLFRVCGSTNDWLTYAVAGPVREARIAAFFAPAQGAVVDPVFLVSADGQTFVPAAPVSRAEKAHIAPPHRGNQHRQTQVDYTFAPSAGTRHVKIVWSVPMALDRVELCHPGR